MEGSPTWVHQTATWRKLHLGADESTGEIVAAVVTTNNVGDSQVLEQRLEQVEEEIEQISGDGSYDKRHCYEAIRQRKAKRDGYAVRYTTHKGKRQTIYMHQVV